MGVVSVGSKQKREEVIDELVRSELEVDYLGNPDADKTPYKVSEYTANGQVVDPSGAPVAAGERKAATTKRQRVLCGWTLCPLAEQSSSTSAAGEAAAADRS